MDLENTDEVNYADEFWDKIESLLAHPCHSHDHIDDALRSYLALVDAHQQQFITTDDHLAHCAYLLYVSPLFAHHAAYIRQQLLYCLLQEDDVNVLRIAVTFLLADARENEETFDLMNHEATFPRLVQLIAQPRENEESLHRSLMELMYELSRIQKITNESLACVTDEFVCRLFDIIEQVSDDVTDPYHYPVIRVLLVLNEQFMVAAVPSEESVPLTNRVVKVLSSHGSRYKTFGENIILLLNREDETSLQLLTLKLMYLLFTTPSTYEYFYTNDLHVLLDILIRNLLDLPEYAAPLRHTYLRVLYPLLKHTQLQHPPYYKRSEIRKLLALLCGDRIENEDASPPIAGAWNHFEDVDETTKRLVHRCQTVAWLSNPDPVDFVRVESPTHDHSPDLDLDPDSPTSPSSPSKPKPPQLPAPRKLRKRDSSKASTLTISQFLIPQLEAARQSSVSMVEMAQQKEKPGIITPSRNPSVKLGLKQAMFAKKEKPPPPKTRRSNFGRTKLPSTSSDLDLTQQEVPEQMQQTQMLKHHTNEPEQYDDAVEVQQVELVKEDALQSSFQVKEAVAEDVASLSQPLSKKPPPAPKARRGWRIRKSKDLTVTTRQENQISSKEPGKFSPTLPSINPVSITKDGGDRASLPVASVPKSSPFSPVKDKTLDPLEDAQGSASPDAGDASFKRSVSDAMSQAQAQAMHQLEECLEGTHLSTNTNYNSDKIHFNKQQHPPRGSSLQKQIDHESLPIQRTVLAPPGQAPIRPVPGPRVHLERSPFLSDDEEVKLKENGEDIKKDDENPGVIGRELRARDSWEDFGDED